MFKIRTVSMISISILVLVGLVGYSLLDIRKYIAGLGRTGDLMWGKIQVDFLKEVKKLDIPVYFFAGKMDYNAPTEFVEKFYDGLQAPQKSMVYFERSGHWIFLEQSKEFSEALIDVALAESD